VGVDGKLLSSQLQAVRKKVGGVHVSGVGGDVESLDDVAGEDGEAVDSEWTQGAGDASEEVIPIIPIHPLKPIIQRDVC
jgi:hypothetical protein